MRFKGLGLGVGFVLLSAVALVAQYAPFYVLDGYGGVHGGGGAPVITPATPYFGWDIARDFFYVPTSTSDTNYGDGLLVLDGFGGVHTGGKLSTVSLPASPYFGWDIARAIAFRRIDPQAYGAVSTTWTDYTSAAWTQVIAESMNMVLPDAGYVIVTISCNIVNPDASSPPSGKCIGADIAIGVNSTSSADAASIRTANLGDAYIPMGSGVNGYPTDIASLTRSFYFNTGGTQRFYFLARRSFGTGTVRILHPSITCLYVNKRWDTYSQSSSGTPLPSDLALAPNSETEAVPGTIKK